MYPCLRQENFSSPFTKRGIQVLVLHKDPFLVHDTTSYLETILAPTWEGDPRLSYTFKEMLRTLPKNLSFIRLAKRSFLKHEDRFFRVAVDVSS
jgi:hypothetical protein